MDERNSVARALQNVGAETRRESESEFDAVEALMSATARLQTTIAILAQLQIELAKQKEALADREAALLLGQVEGILIDGKNAEVRAAQIRQATKSEREAVQKIEQNIIRIKAELEREREYTSALKTILRFVAAVHENE